ncbi:MAG: hypothetical protein RXR18_04345 [Nitrososphaeria archaeon]
MQLFTLFGFTDLLPALEEAGFPEVSRVTPLYGCYSVVIYYERYRLLYCRNHYIHCFLEDVQYAVKV